MSHLKVGDRVVLNVGTNKSFAEIVGLKDSKDSALGAPLHEPLQDMMDSMAGTIESIEYDKAVVKWDVPSYRNMRIPTDTRTHDLKRLKRAQK